MGNQWFWEQYIISLATCPIYDEKRIIKILDSLNKERVWETMATN